MEFPIFLIILTFVNMKGGDLVCKYDAVEGPREIPIVSPFLWAFWEEKKKDASLFL